MRDFKIDKNGYFIFFDTEDKKMNEEQVECPKCNGTLDTGGECNDCDYDRRKGKQNFIDGFREVSKSGDKHKIADFLRKNTYGNA